LFADEPVPARLPLHVPDPETDLAAAVAVVVAVVVAAVVAVVVAEHKVGVWAEAMIQKYNKKKSKSAIGKK
jgi:hypothetical protein